MVNMRPTKLRSIVLSVGLCAASHRVVGVTGAVWFVAGTAMRNRLSASQRELEFERMRAQFAAKNRSSTCEGGRHQPT